MDRNNNREKNGQDRTERAEGLLMLVVVEELSLLEGSCGSTCDLHESMEAPTLLPVSSGQSCIRTNQSSNSKGMPQN